VCCFLLDLFGLCVVSSLTCLAFVVFLSPVKTQLRGSRGHKSQTSQERNNTKAKQVKEETTHNPNKSRKKQHKSQTSQERNNTKAKQVKEVVSYLTYLDCVSFLT
jgi:uncharacterized membrane protein YhiD involved in acid resistance